MDDLNTIFNFINCLIAVLSLFIGVSAHKQIQKNKKSFNDNKDYKDNSKDYSQKANYIVNYGSDSKQLLEFSNKTYEKVFDIINKGYTEMYINNIKEILDKTTSVIENYHLKVASFTKVDWINFFIECAKVASDKNMQEVWVKVLTKEVTSPESFSYTTLDVLKNMSYMDYCLFEKLCSIAIEGYILQGEKSEIVIEWQEQLKLQELRLLNLAPTMNSIMLLPKGEEKMYLGNKYEIGLTNNKNESVNVMFDIFMLTNAAIELLSVTDYEFNEEYIKGFIEEIEEKYGKFVQVSYFEKVE